MEENGGMPAKLGSKEGTNRDATRGASQDVVGNGPEAPKAQAGYSFFGDSGGRNDVGNTPVDRGSSKPTL